MEDVTYRRCAHFYNLVHCGPVFTLEWFSLTLSKNATLYYAGYLTMTVCYFYPMVLSVLISAKANGRFRIPNPEVMTDWMDHWRCRILGRYSQDVRGGSDK
jgi:hypothetical protein